MRRFVLAVVLGSAGLGPALRAQTGLPHAALASGPSPNELVPRAIGERHRGIVTLPGSPLAFLPIDFAGRCDLLRLDPTRPRRVVGPDGVTRLALPGGISLYRYRRAGSPARFGFLAVDSDGVPRVVIELPGAPGPTDDPFLPFLGVRRDGARVAVATKEDAGGDLFLARPDGGPLASGASVVNLGGPGAFEFASESLTLGAGSLFIRDGEATLLRAPDDGSAAPSAVAVPPSQGATPEELRAEMAVSEDGSTVAFLAGADEESLDLYLAFQSGLVSNLTQDPGPLRDPGHAPGSAFGPRLALAPDGSRVAYSRGSNGEDELFVREVSAPSPVQLTADPLFEPYIDNVVIVTFLAPDRLVFAAGSTAGGGFDAYRASFPSSGVSIENLTGTSSVSSPPFQPGTITLRDAVRLPDGNEILVSQSAGGFDLHGFGLLSGSGSLLLTTEGVPTNWASAGGRAFFTAIVGNEVRVFATDPAGGGGVSLATLVVLPEGVSVAGLAPSATGSEAIVLASGGAGIDLAPRVAVPSGGASLLLPFPLALARTLAWSAGGAPLLAASLVPGGPNAFARVAPTGPVLLDPLPGFGSFLP